MSDAREGILGDIRRALGRSADDDPARATAVAARLAAPPLHPRPAVGADLSARFIARFEARAGTVARVADDRELPAACEAFRTRHDLPTRVAVGLGVAPDGRGLRLAWPAHWQVHHDAAGRDETLAISRAFAGIAETGTLMLLAGPAAPTTHNFVPDNQIIVLGIADLVAHVEDAWARLHAGRARMPPAMPPAMPRVVNLISGPSRTADIEQTIQLGAHGPRRLHLVLIG